MSALDAAHRPPMSGAVHCVIDLELVVTLRSPDHNGVIVFGHLDQKRCNRLPSSCEPSRMETALLAARGRQASCCAGYQSGRHRSIMAGKLPSICWGER
jgi:hypothetical protein